MDKKTIIVTLTSLFLLILQNSFAYGQKSYVEGNKAWLGGITVCNNTHTTNGIGTYFGHYHAYLVCENGAFIDMGEAATLGLNKKCRTTGGLGNCQNTNVHLVIGSSPTSNAFSDVFCQTTLNMKAHTTFTFDAGNRNINSSCSVSVSH